jgi:hypothetical protein
LGLSAAALWPAFRNLREWFRYSGAKLLRVDYSLYVASSRIGMEEGWHHLYDLEPQRRVFAAMPGLWWFPNVHTPALSVLMVPFTWLSLDAGYALWRLFLLACVIFTWYWLAPGDLWARITALVLLFVPYPVMLGLYLGQIVPVQMAGVVLCYLLLERGRDRAAGSLLAVLVALKPQGLFLLPFALFFAARRRCFVSWAVSSLLLGAALLALIGTDGAVAYAERLSYAQSHLAEFWVSWTLSLARHFEHPLTLRLVELLVCAVTMVTAWRQAPRTEIAIAAGLSGSLVASPFLHLQDYLLLLPAGWLVLRAIPHPATVFALLLGYAAMLTTATPTIGGRWVLLFTCLVPFALVLLPPRRLGPAPAAAP